MQLALQGPRVLKVFKALRVLWGLQGRRALRDQLVLQAPRVNKVYKV